MNTSKIFKRSALTGITIMLLAIGFTTAQVCPPGNNSGRYSARSVGFGSGGIFNNAYNVVDRLSFSFNNIVSQGYRDGNLTKNEVYKLERDFRNVEREIRWAYADGRISLHENSMIDIQMRRLQRSIDREWNDTETAG